MGDADLVGDDGLLTFEEGLGLVLTGAVVAAAGLTVAVMALILKRL